MRLPLDRSSLILSGVIGVHTVGLSSSALYEDVERGISLGCPFSPLIGAVPQAAG